MPKQNSKRTNMVTKLPNGDTAQIVNHSAKKLGMYGLFLCYPKAWEKLDCVKLRKMAYNMTYLKRRMSE